MFAGRELIVATKHHKEKIIGPLVASVLQVKVITSDAFDSDVFGTFTGEVKRTDDALLCARNKCKAALALSGLDLAVASEGSFGPHPSLFFATANEELILLYDQKNKCEFTARALSLATNCDQKEIHSVAELKAFALKAKFPSHALILRKEKNEFSDCVKGITDWDELNTCFERLIAGGKSVHIETDMRALYNPMRQEVILQATQNLIDRLLSECPSCKLPGYGFTQSRPGLPCGLCGFPTKSVIVHEFGCQFCNHTSEALYPNGKKKEDPMYCSNCNP